MVGDISVDFSVPSVYKNLERQGKVSIVHMLENLFYAGPFLTLRIDSVRKKKGLRSDPLPIKAEHTKSDFQL